MPGRESRSGETCFTAFEVAEIASRLMAGGLVTDPAKACARALELLRAAQAELEKDQGDRQLIEKIRAEHASLPSLPVPFEEALRLVIGDHVPPAEREKRYRQWLLSQGFDSKRAASHIRDRKGGGFAFEHFMPFRTHYPDWWKQHAQEKAS